MTSRSSQRGSGRSGATGGCAPTARRSMASTWRRLRRDCEGSSRTDLAEPLSSRTASEPTASLRWHGRVPGFGPGSAKDVASWAGLSLTRILPVVEHMRLRRFRDEQGGELLDLPRAPLPDHETQAPVRFLPTWDATLLVHAHRTQILPEPYRPLVFDTSTPHSVSTFLVDGAVAGTWRYEDRRVRLEPFDPLPRWARRELQDEAKRLAAFHGD